MIRSKATDAELVKRFQVEGAAVLAREFGVDLGTVYRWAKRLGVSCRGNRVRAERNTSCDIHYFDQWTADVAYVLGFLFADGSVSSCLRTVTIDVTRSDEAVLQFVKEQWKSPKLIRRYPGRGRTKPYSRLTVGSKIFVESLMRLGVMPRKTFRDDPFPTVPDKVFGHFVRGFFDGDGSAGRDDRRSIKVKFIGTPKFIRGLCDSLSRLARMKHKNSTVTHGKVASWCEVSWTHPQDLRAFYDLVYPADGFGFCYERKRQRLHRWLSKPRIEMKRWTDEALAVLREHYPTLGPTRVGRMIGRATNSVRIKADKIGLRYQPIRDREEKSKCQRLSQ